MRTLKLAGIAAIETLVNQALKYDPVSKKRLENLQGQVFGFHFQQPDLDVYLMIETQQLRLMGQWDGDTQAEVSGLMKDFIQLASAEDKTQALMEFGLQVQGSTQSLSVLQSVMSSLNIDWEAAIADVTGDVPGHLIADGIRFLASSAQSIIGNLDRSSRNFIKEESGLFAHPVQAEEFSKKVADVRFQSDRLQARINKLKQQMEAIQQ